MQHLLHKILKKLRKHRTAKKKEIHQYFGASLSPAAPRRTGILPRLRDFQVLLKIPEKRHLARNISLISARSSRQLAGQSSSNRCNPPDLRPSHGVLSSLISRTPSWRSSLCHCGKYFHLRRDPKLWRLSAVAIGVWLLCVSLRSAAHPVTNRKNNSWIFLIHPDVSGWGRCDESPGGCFQADLYQELQTAAWRRIFDSSSQCGCWQILLLLLSFSFWVFLWGHLTLMGIFEHYQYAAAFLNRAFSFLCIYPCKAEQIFFPGLVVSSSKAQIPDPTPGSPEAGE